MKLGLLGFALITVVSCSHNSEPCYGVPRGAAVSLDNREGTVYLCEGIEPSRHAGVYYDSTGRQIMTTHFVSSTPCPDAN
jgi:hypothetical protein